ncbi:PucR family transcriptional regulator [Mycobacterium botniense]|uniref:PucR family transcriptional regulator n=1 Tax=Mycobacterium botniense TaxID=84962 RepID=UPI001C3FDB24|nr:helix-turn-helix domain-containing protein [Mycobacterium botniense]
MSSQADFDINGTPGSLWLERPGGAGPLDDLLLDRASVAARLLLGSAQTKRVTGVSDPALVEVVLSRRESAADRRRALRRLGLAPHLPLRVAAVSVEPDRDPAAEAIALLTCKQRVQSVCVAGLGAVAAVLFQHDKQTDALADWLRTALRDLTDNQHRNSGIRIGVGSSVDSGQAEKSWRQAVLALRFAAPSDLAGQTWDPVSAVVDFGTLGVLAVLAEVPSARLRDDPDVAALDALGETDHGDLDIAALEAFCRTGSLRQAAQVLYLHHSSVAARLARIESTFGWHLDDPADRFKAQLTLWARRIAHAPGYR